MTKKLIIFVSIVLIGATFYTTINSNDKTNTVQYEGFEASSTLSDDHVFTTTSENGDVVELDIAKLEKEVQEEIKNKEIVNATKSIGGTRNLVNGVVNFRTKPSAEFNTNYVEDGTNRSGYTNGYYGTDGAFLGYNNDGTKVKFMQAGVIGWVNASEVEILDYDDNNVVKSVNYYNVKNGMLVHYGTTNLRSPYYSMNNLMGYKASYMNEGDIYYSYDGHYFYKTYAQMIADYKNNTRNNSINPTNPFYNYYQFLSHRTKTNLSASQLDAYLNMQTTDASSKMKNMGQYFIKYQDEYGSNALLMFAVAANESNWGLSAIAKSKNNIFGHAAYDASAGSSATGYYSPDKSIYSHARYFVSEGYLDPLDYSGRYYGAHLGDKASGMNVKYASDPYWGEKAAAIAWKVQKSFENAKDANKYTIAIKDKGFDLNVRAVSNSSSALLYRTGKTGDYPFVVLSQESGENVNGNATWYKIQSDSTLNANRTAITRDKGEYDFNKYYAYINASYAKIVSNGNGSSTPSVTPSGKGDVNGNGKIDAADYLMIMDTILGKYTMNEQQKSAGDVNGNNKIDAADYLMLMDHILGKITIK